MEGGDGGVDVFELAFFHPGNPLLFVFSVDTINCVIFVQLPLELGVSERDEEQTGGGSTCQRVVSVDF